MIIDGIKKAFGLKDSISEFFSVLSFILKAKDRLDDDLDANGKSELEDILDELKSIELVVLATVKEVHGDLQHVILRGSKLKEYVLKGDK